MLLNRTVLYSGESHYGRYKVVDTVYNGRSARVLYGSQRSPQSGVATDDNPELLFDYNQRFLEILMSHKPKKILVIGGGAFMLPIAAFHQFLELTVEVVEIDPLLVKLAEQYFDLPDDKRMKVHIEDGLNFIARTKKKFDVIIIDAFSGYTIPHHLLEHDTIVQYQKHLKRNGVIALNFISEYKRTRPQLAHELVASFGEVFSHVALYQADVHYMKGEEQNMLLVAGNRPAHFEYLHSTELELFTAPGSP